MLIRISEASSQVNKLSKSSENETKATGAQNFFLHPFKLIIFGVCVPTTDGSFCFHKAQSLSLVLCRTEASGWLCLVYFNVRAVIYGETGYYLGTNYMHTLSNRFQLFIYFSHFFTNCKHI